MFYIVGPINYSSTFYDFSLLCMNVRMCKCMCMCVLRATISAEMALLSCSLDACVIAILIYPEQNK